MQCIRRLRIPPIVFLSLRRYIEVTRLDWSIHV